MPRRSLGIGRSAGDSHDNALAESINGPCTAKVIHRRGPWRRVEASQFATLDWVDRFTPQEPIGTIPPPEATERDGCAEVNPILAASLEPSRPW